MHNTSTTPDAGAHVDALHALELHTLQGKQYPSALAAGGTAVVA